ncbi:MAG: alanine--tRNA ligase [Candidatus Taylorbacteria bacterium CG11_big_fil_rev_8_21_14_0_20_46_11]|uniref:alanine--tRNA ligase n=1 Tax=Candidatus Taylorbacteria bacterium CG11_big_fil_rev_8_21_14_0_20_46_11 TaxID=1975025 RepID=A0A2H0KBI3_9BACT|nr:MAG: alanine--tRNA ligase [Candidatus Taylorbacteria bacterium CG11_big_fil_rev_8_21_14_0_20_46_11]
MTIGEVRQKYLAFFKERGHVIVPSSSLVPENDPTTLFTGSGMQPMVPYLLGEKHPMGTRIVDSQKCFRSQDIDEVGDNRHTTFFEMLGNWSLGDYWKEEQLSWIFEFLTKELGIQKERLWVSYFKGDERFEIPEDTESKEIWQRLGILPNHILPYDAKKNWWSRAGVPENMPVGEPGGPDSEIFFDFDPENAKKEHEASEWKNEACHPNCDCGRFMEIGNCVFMEYKKIEGGFEKLPQKNVDFGGGLERITSAVNDEPDVFRLNVFSAIVKNLEQHTDKKYDDVLNQKSYRIVLDHIRASVLLMSDGVMPSNTDQGYFVRRLLRRAIVHLDKLGIPSGQLENPHDSIISAYKEHYPATVSQKATVLQALNAEEQQFRKTLTSGLREFEKVTNGKSQIDSATAFNLFSSHGLPIDMIIDLAKEKGLDVDRGGFDAHFNSHKELSRAGADKKFKGGLADTSEMSVKYHTATHLLHQALRDVLGDEVRQKGSNITPERLRFDFAFPRKMTYEEKKKVEDIVNQKIAEKLPMQKVVLPFAEAEKTGALHFFGEKYGDQVNVYFIGNSLDTAYSKEFCGGPHIENTSALGTFKIAKEEAVSAGVRRVKATLS